MEEVTWETIRKNERKMPERMEEKADNEKREGKGNDDKENSSS